MQTVQEQTNHDIKLWDREGKGGAGAYRGAAIEPHLNSRARGYGLDRPRQVWTHQCCARPWCLSPVITDCSSGTYSFVRYDGAELWHERLAFGWVDNTKICGAVADLYIGCTEYRTRQ
eukprot:2790370-Amphidinium_carterae.1